MWNGKHDLEHDGFGSDILAGILALKTEYALPLELDTWLKYAAGYMEGSKMPDKFREHELHRLTEYFKRNLAKSDQHSVKGDRFTEGLTPDKMVHNLLETGTPFDYKDVDFLAKWLKERKDNKDKMSAKMPPLLVGNDSNPDKNQIYIDKEKTFEDEE